MLKLSIAQLRIAILAVNFLVTSLVAAHAVYRTFHKYPEVVNVDKEMRLNAEIYKPSESGRGADSGRRNFIAEVASKGISFLKIDPLPQKIDVPTPGPGPAIPGGEGKIDPVTGAPQLDPGPLDAEWEFTQAILFDYDPEANIGCLVRKSSQPSAAPSTAAGARKVISAPRRSVVKTRNPSTPGGTPAQPVDQVYLKTYADWTANEETGLVIWVVQVTPSQFIYEDQTNNLKLHALRRKTREVVKELPDGEAVLEVEKPEVDPNNPEAGKEEKPLIEIGFTKSRKDRFDDRRKNPAAAKGASSGSLTSTAPGKTSPIAGLTSPTSGIRGAPPKSKEEQLKDLGNTLRALKDSKTVPEKDKKELEKMNEIMKGSTPK